MLIKLDPLGAHVHRTQLLIGLLSLFLLFTSFPNIEATKQLSLRIVQASSRSTELSQELGIDRSEKVAPAAIASDQARLDSLIVDAYTIKRSSDRLRRSMDNVQSAFNTPPRASRPFRDEKVIFIAGEIEIDSIADKVRRVRESDLTEIDSARAAGWIQRLGNMVARYERLKKLQIEISRRIAKDFELIQSEIELQFKIAETANEAELRENLEKQSELSDHISKLSAMNTVLGELEKDILEAQILLGQKCDAAADCATKLQKISDATLDMPIGVKVSLKRLREVVPILYAGLFALLCLHMLQIAFIMNISPQQAADFRSQTLFYVMVLRPHNLSWGMLLLSEMLEIGKFGVVGISLWAWSSLAPNPAASFLDKLMVAFIALYLVLSTAANFRITNASLMKTT